MFGAGNLDAGTLLGLGVVLAVVGGGVRLAAARGVDPFPVPLVIGLVVSAVGPLHGLRPDAEITRVGAEIAVVVLLFCVGLDHGAADRSAAATMLGVGPVLVVDAACNFIPGALFGLVAGFGATGAVLLGGVTWASSWAVASGTLDRHGRFGNRETPAALATLVVEHAATGVYLPLAAALLAPGDTASRLTALFGSAAAVVAAVAWLVLGSAPAIPGPVVALLDSGPAPGVSLVLLLAGVALALAGVAAAIGVATAGIAYLAGAVLASFEPAVADLARLRPAVGALRELSAAAAGLTLGLLVPGGKLPGAVAGGIVLAAITGATKVLTGWWAAGRLRPPGSAGRIGAAGRLRAGLPLLARGELAVALGILAALRAPDGGPGTGLAALAAVEVVLTGAAASVAVTVTVRDLARPGWYRWAVPTPAAARPEPPGAG